MPTVKIGVQTRSLRQPLKQAIQTAARLRADGVEINVRNELPAEQMSQTALRQFRKLLDDSKLRVSAVAFPTRRGYDSPDDLERRVLATQAAMRLAYDLRAEVVINRVGQLPDEESSPRFAEFLAVLSSLGQYGQRVGARLAAQTSGQSPQQLARIVAALPDHSIGIDLHPSALIHGGHSPQEAVELLGPHILHVHACDAVREAAGGRSSEVELGRGMADFPELLGRLTEFDYRGWVTIERLHAADPIVEIDNAVEFLRSL